MCRAVRRIRRRAPIAHGSAICTPKFHCQRGWQVRPVLVRRQRRRALNAGGRSRGSGAAEVGGDTRTRSVDSRPGRRSELPSGRSKNLPAPPRNTNRCVPLMSYAKPRRGAGAIDGHLYPVFTMPSPPTKIPLVALPVFGTSWPIASVEVGPRNSPVSGCMACRFVPLHG